MSEALLSIDRLETEINKIIDKHFDNIELKRILVKIYTDKGLAPEKINAIMNEEMSLVELSDAERIAFANGCAKMFTNNEYLDVSKYYANTIIESYDSFTIETQKNDIIELTNFQQKNDYEYYGLISYKKIFEYMTSGLFKYNIDIQRAPSFKSIGKRSIRTATVDKQNCNSIKKVMIKNDYEDSQIVLTLLIKDDGSVPKFDFKKKFENIGDLVIGSPLMINDGFHRCLACTDAYMEYKQINGVELDNSMAVKLVICDSVRAKRITAQSFKRSNTDINWLKANEENDYTNFVNKLIENSKTLKGNVGATWEEAKALNKVTYKNLLIDMTKKMNIEVGNKGVTLIKSKKMATYIDTFFELLNDSINDDSKDYSYVYSSNMFAVYFKLVYDMSEDGENIDLYTDLIDKVLNMSAEDIKKLKLEYKNTTINSILEYFKGGN